MHWILPTLRCMCSSVHVWFHLTVASALPRVHRDAGSLSAHSAGSETCRYTCGPWWCIAKCAAPMKVQLLRLQSSEEKCAARPRKAEHVQASLCRRGSCRVMEGVQLAASGTDLCAPRWRATPSPSRASRPSGASARSRPSCRRSSPPGRASASPRGWGHVSRWLPHERCRTVKESQQTTIGVVHATTSEFEPPPIKDDCV